MVDFVYVSYISKKWKKKKKTHQFLFEDKGKKILIFSVKHLKEFYDRGHNEYI